jgi:hypothetical protein
MTQDDFREMVEAVVERKLIELFGDPDANFELVPTLRERLMRQQVAVTGGERGTSLDDVVASLGLE